MQLRDVLAAFESGGPMSLGQMSRQYHIEVSALEGMIAFWVRKGKLREVGQVGCATCGTAHCCPVLTAAPRRYELVTASAEPTTAPCNCKR